MKQIKSFKNIFYLIYYIPKIIVSTCNQNKRILMRYFIFFLPPSHTMAQLSPTVQLFNGCAWLLATIFDNKSLNRQFPCLFYAPGGKTVRVLLTTRRPPAPSPETYPRSLQYLAHQQSCSCQHNEPPITTSHWRVFRRYISHN